MPIRQFFPILIAIFAIAINTSAQQVDPLDRNVRLLMEEADRVIESTSKAIKEADGKIVSSEVELMETLAEKPSDLVKIGYAMLGYTQAILTASNARDAAHNAIAKAGFRYIENMVAAGKANLEIFASPEYRKWQTSRLEIIREMPQESETLLKEVNKKLETLLREKMGSIQPPHLAL